jgi:hypothetical protein
VKVLTLTQPWASLVACGAKRIETRSWSTSYRGDLAIHAAKGMPRDAKDFSRCIRLGVLFGPQYEYPRGVIIATCRLLSVVPTEVLVNQGNVFSVSCEPISEQEEGFGDYSPGRFGWLLGEIKPLPDPISAKGALGLWEFAGL